MDNDDGAVKLERPDEPLQLSWTLTRAQWQELYNEGAESCNGDAFHAQFRVSLINNYLLPAGDR